MPFLTKTTSGLQNDPDLFWATMFKGVYFPNSYLLSVVKGARSSCVWTSILARRDVFRTNGI